MKPKANGHAGDGLAAGNDDYDEVSLYKAYETVGLLITESRLPERSAKGRREGAHIPQNIPTHKPCRDDNDECQKVRRYKEAIANLCYNGIPLCAEVLLCPLCEIGAADSCNERAIPLLDHTHEVGSAHSDSYVLLEQWTIQQVHSRADSATQSLQNLCNAVRSQLCFSQLSAWLQLSQGVTPKHIFCRLTAPGEWFVHKFVMSPQSHKFPDATLGRSRHALRVTLSSLPRTSLTPYEISIASRDKLFAVKDASPLLRKSRSSFNNLGSPSENSAEGCDISRPVVTSSERTHSRSKSVRGMQDLAGRKAAGDARPRTVAQRHSEYLKDVSIASSASLAAAEQLASFSTVPTDSINKLELISCTTGPPGAPGAKASPPERLSITGARGTSLKSPKVLFTRTSMRENFFTVPSFSCSSDLSSQFSAIDIDSNADADDQLSAIKHRPHFDLGEDNSPHKLVIRKHARRKLQPSLSDEKPLTSEHSQHEQTHETEVEQSRLLLEDCQRVSNGQTHRNGTVGNGQNSTNGTQNGSQNGSQNGNSRTLKDEDSFSLETVPHGDILNSSTPADKHITQQADDAKMASRKSRKQKSQEERMTSSDMHITSTPINKKLQNLKHPQTSRSRLFKQRPLQSSPAPVKRIGRNNFGYDKSINNIEAIKNALSCTSLSDHNGTHQEGERSNLVLSSSAPAFTSAALQSHNSLLGNFEESLLNGRIDPAGVVDGFTVDIGASGSFCPNHVSLPVEAYFFNSLSDNDASSPYLGYVDLSEVSRRGYQIPRKGTLQITLFYPNHKVNKMFVVTYNLTDMPPKSQTFIRQKTIYAPCEQQANGQHSLHKANSSDNRKLPTYLRYLIHLRFLSTKTNKIFLHTDIRLIYARDKFEFDCRVASYELRSFIESPSNPKYSPVK